MTRGLTHLDARGAARMVDVAGKAATRRSASARAAVTLTAAAARALTGNPKGDVFQIARIAGIQAAKRTHELIPLCHPLALDAVAVDLVRRGRRVEIRATVGCSGPTGVEMEALTAASVAALTVYDMLKATGHDLVIGPVELLAKDGGASGRVRRKATR